MVRFGGVVAAAVATSQTFQAINFVDLGYQVGDYLAFPDVWLFQLGVWQQATTVQVQSATVLEASFGATVIQAINSLLIPSFSPLLGPGIPMRAGGNITTAA